MQRWKRLDPQKWSALEAPGLSRISGVAYGSGHNVYLTWLARYGLVGFCLSMPFLLYPFRALRIGRKSPLAMYAFVALGLTTATMVTYMAYDYFDLLEPQYIAFAVIYAIIDRTLGSPSSKRSFVRPSVRQERRSPSLFGSRLPKYQQRARLKQHSELGKGEQVQGTVVEHHFAMCGIVGFVGARAALKAGLLAQCAAALRHRGPDDAGRWSSEDGLVQFGHCRLAIIDLSAAGHQPMSDRSGRVWITFNGEIYNYRELRSRLQELGHIFQTATDTEVILEAYREWGIDCLAQLNGMFSFALFDRETRKVFLARDRAGEKPLFYSYRSGSLCFASELKGLMCDPAFSRTLDLHALDFYLAYGYVPNDMCILQGVSKLPPGAVLSFDLACDKIEVRPYWRLPAPGADPECGDDELVNELDRLLHDSVRLRLVADVPVGILLSGGIDSSLDHSHGGAGLSQASKNLHRLISRAFES